MATYVIYADAADDWVYGASATYTTARSTATGTGTDLNILDVGQAWFSGPWYECYEGFVSFDTSTVTGTPYSATLSLYGIEDVTTTSDFTMNARAKDWGTSVTTADWTAYDSLSSLPLRATFNTTGFATSAYNDFTADSSFASNLSNPVRLCLSSSRHEAGTTPTGEEHVKFNATDGTVGTANDPKLTILTTAIAVDQANAGTNGDSTTSSSTSVTTTQAVAAGALIVVAVGWNDNGTHTTGISSASGGSLNWGVAASGANGNQQQVAGMVYAYAPSGLASGTTITINFSASVTGKTSAVASFLGVAGTPTAGSASYANSGSWSSSVTGPTGSLVVSAAALFTTGSSTPSGCTEDLDFSSVTADSLLTICHQISGGGSVTNQGTWSTSNQWTSVSVAFEDATTGWFPEPNSPFMLGTINRASARLI